jgi:hypothetical protein
MARADLVRQARGFEGAQPTDLERVEFIGLTIAGWRHVGDAAAMGVAHELAVEIGPAFGLDLAFERAADVVVGARAELLRDEVTGVVAHALLDVVA